MSTIAMRTFDEITDDFAKLAADIRTANLAKAAYPTGTLVKLTGIRDELRSWRRSQAPPSFVTVTVGKTIDTARRRPPGIYPDHKYEYKPDTDASARALRQ